MFRGLLAAVFLALALTFGAHTSVRAADPSAATSPGASPVLIDPLDPRAGNGANRVGTPLLAIVFVLGVGAITVVATFAFVRVTRRT